MIKCIPGKGSLFSSAVVWVFIYMNRKLVVQILHYMAKMYVIYILNTKFQWISTSSFDVSIGQLNGYFIQWLIFPHPRINVYITIIRADSRFTPSQWETALFCNDVSHWLGASLESAWIMYQVHDSENLRRPFTWHIEHTHAYEFQTQIQSLPELCLYLVAASKMCLLLVTQYLKVRFRLRP